MNLLRSIPFQARATPVALHAKACVVRWSEAVFRNGFCRSHTRADFAFSFGFSLLFGCLAVSVACFSGAQTAHPA
jgi:hypothetical protein